MTITPAIGEWSRSTENGSIHPSILVIGLGNPILGDDGVGWRVAEQVAERILSTGKSAFTKKNSLPQIGSPIVEVDCLSLGGLSLMERMIGYARVIIVDAITTGISPCGTVTKTLLSDLPERALGHLCSAHDTTLQNALRVGWSMGAELPAEIIVVGIEAQQVYDFSTELSPAVEDSIPVAVNLIMEALI